MTGVVLGETIAGYRLEAVAGHGGMGVVYRATQLRLGRTVAFKVIAPDFARHPDYRRRFQREARLAASIEHPNVIPVYEADELESGELYLAMRWVEGTDLRDLLAREGVLTAPHAARLLAPVARALGAAHSHGLVHRDVKPANILIAPGGDTDGEHVYLTDFGIARAPDEEPGLTRTGAFVGSLAYAAPERIEGEQGGPAADIYALGCVLFETLTGHAPFNRESELATMRAHLDDPVPSVCAEAAGVPPELDEVVRIALAKAPGQRFATATEMALGLEVAVTGTTVARPAPAASRPEANVADRTSDETVVSQAAPRRSPRAAVIALGALAASGDCGACADHQQQRRQPISTDDPDRPEIGPAVAGTPQSGWPRFRRSSRSALARLRSSEATISSPPSPIPAAVESGSSIRAEGLRRRSASVANRARWLSSRVACGSRTPDRTMCG